MKPILYFLCSILITILLWFGLGGNPGYTKPFGGPIPAQPPPLRGAPLPLPPIPGAKPIPVDLTQLQKQYQELRTQRDRLEKEIDLSVARIRQLKTELKNADNPVSKFFYRRQLETQFESFREKVDQLGAVESRLTVIIHELGKRITLEPGSIRPNFNPRPGPFPKPPIRPLPPPPPIMGPEWEPEPLTFPPGFEQWQPTEKEQYIQEQIQRIADEKKQLDNLIQQHQKELTKLKKMLEEIKPLKSNTTPK